MRTQVLDMILLFNILRVCGTCEEGDEYIFSENQVEAQRCIDEKYLYATNNRSCLERENKYHLHCKWNTTISQWCAHTEECVWLNHNTIEDVCYCAESSDCDAFCHNHSSIRYECPENCRIIWGCFGVSCSCGFGGCDHPEESGCRNPVDANSHTITWGVALDVFDCCFPEELIKNTTSSVVKVLGLNDDQVTVKEYRNETFSGPYWFILYTIELGGGEFSWEIMEDLDYGSRLTSIQRQIENDLKINDVYLETFCLGLDENDPRDKSASSESASSESASSDSTGTTVGIIIGVLVVAVLGVLLCYKYVWNKKSKLIL